jgi:hypothetical protein
MAIEKELLDQLLAGRDLSEVFGKDGLLDDLKKAFRRVFSMPNSMNISTSSAAKDPPPMGATALRRRRF